MRLSWSALVLAALAPASARAQESSPAKMEIGVGIAGLSVVAQEGETVTAFGVPNSTFVAPAAVYASFFVTPKLALEPQLGLLVLSGEGESFHIVSLTTQVDYFPRGNERSSPYLFGRGSLLNAGGEDESDTRFSLGGGLGYRIPVGGRAVFRLEGRLDHRLEKGSDPSANIFSVAVSLGIGL